MTASPSPPGPLEHLLKDNDLEWTLELFSSREQAITSLLRSLESASQESRRRFGESAPQFSEAHLAGEAYRNPHKVRAFLQALSVSRSQEMLVMVWRILQ